jgi:type IV pilus assembly protein PilA
MWVRGAHGRSGPGQQWKGTHVRGRLQSIGSEDGFTVIELLVVILIIGILAAIAIPSFLNQTQKANDASAKELAHTAQIAAESYATDHSGSYAGLNNNLSVLPTYDATIQITSGDGAYVSGVTASSAGYSVTTTSPNSADSFTITRNNGAVTRTCTPATGLHGGCANGSW